VFLSFSWVAACPGVARGQTLHSFYHDGCVILWAGDRRSPDGWLALANPPIPEGHAAVLQRYSKPIRIFDTIK